MEATGGIEPPNRGFADPRLNHLATSPLRLAPWCRGRDLNPHELTFTAPSRLRVYQFHHLGIVHQNTISETGAALKGPGLVVGTPSDEWLMKKNGRSGRIRTPDHWFWRPAL